MQGLQIDISACNNSLNTSRPCVNESLLDSRISTVGGQIFAHMMFINPLINPGNVDYLDYYINDINMIMFSKANGAIASAYVQ